MTNINVVVLAAGLGTRMRSRLAKVLHRVGGMTLVEHVVRAASALTSPDRITVVVGHQANEVSETLGGWRVNFIHQTEQQGTGHALLCCREALRRAGGLLLVLYGDTPLLTSATLQRLVAWHQKRDASGTLISTRLEDPSGYGRVILDDQGYVQAIVEQNAATPDQLSVLLINSGIYCFNAETLWEHILELRPNNPANEYYLTDIVEFLNRAKHRVQSLEIEDSDELLGINTRVELAAVDSRIRNRKTRELMLAGVTIEKPETVTVDAQVRVGMDTIIGPCAQLLGDTIIGEDCRIGAGSMIENSQLADRVLVAPMTMISSSSVREDSRIGPYSRLRPGNHVGAGAHIGNFVELKKTRLGSGSKANHLAYLGDSEIGERVNVGAGTIICNYDGVHKYPTRIGQGSFVGSNSTLVAPLQVGENSYIAAGSVITDEVPPGALALGRGRQVVKEGWVEKKKNKSNG